MTDQTNFLEGTLDTMMKALATEEMHGLGISRRTLEAS